MTREGRAAHWVPGVGAHLAALYPQKGVQSMAGLSITRYCRVTEALHAAVCMRYKG